MMSIPQILRVLWVRKWLSLSLFALIAVVGAWVAMQMPQRYYAQTSLFVEVRPDPVLGTLAAPFNMAGQLEVMQSDMVSLRAVELLEFTKDEGLALAWRNQGAPGMSLELFAAHVLRTGLKVEASRSGSQILVGYLSEDPAFAARAANAYARAAIDVSVQMRVEPSRESATFLGQQIEVLRKDLEAAQARLTQFQRERGLPTTDERLSQEATRLTALQTQLATAEAERLEVLGRQRGTGMESSPDVLQDEQVRALRGQISAAEARLSEISSVVGVNHPQRRQLEAQLAELREQLSAQVARVSSGAAVASRVSAQKVQELRALVEAQNRRLLAMRSDYDQAAVLQREVDAAQRAFDNLRQRGGQVNLESQVQRSMLRPMSPALEPQYPSRKRTYAALAAALALGFAIAVVVPLAWEILDPRVRSLSDLLGDHGVPVIGTMRAPESKAPVLRHPIALPATHMDYPALPGTGSSS